MSCCRSNSSAGKILFLVPLRGILGLLKSEVRVCLK